MRFRLLVVGLVMIGAMAQASADDADIWCRDIGAERGTADYRECRSLIAQMNSSDDYFAMMARARLTYLAQHIADRARRQRELPDFSHFGVPAPGQHPAPSHGCVMFGDDMGGGIADCD